MFFSKSMARLLASPKPYMGVKPARPLRLMAQSGRLLGLCPNVETRSRLRRVTHWQSRRTTILPSIQPVKMPLEPCQIKWGSSSYILRRNSEDKSSHPNVESEDAVNIDNWKSSEY